MAAIGKAIKELYKRGSTRDGKPLYGRAEPQQITDEIKALQVDALHRWVNALPGDERTKLKAQAIARAPEWWRDNYRDINPCNFSAMNSDRDRAIRLARAMYRISTSTA